MSEKRKPYIRIRPDGAHVRFMAAADGYVMARLSGCMPFVVGVREWNGWTEAPS